MKFVLFREHDGLWYWRLQADDLFVVAVSPKGLQTRETALDLIHKVRSTIPYAPVFDRAGNLQADV
ncbi:MAG: DUF1508 domain-containing protein [Oxalobacteraceae bacterium]|nr:MAG: DUF1508 domain-containing protein [Oxalobacteraceae bacterium]